ncbi:Protein of unknown function [Microbacterium sp. cf046]|uniref:DUF2510 domain-containing protein n=1 Tax=Microbacterium sp. cf046 TaxID=1761803 RepID=UPI0008EA47FA|nr:DUF2510 domain-containing protein [Microbacterium sp. cf046]SFS15681.1 Protein of unknown function [Microbacterium sp. cf046]
MATTPPGWYDDGRGALRWWDGAQWTEHVQTPDPEPEVDQPVIAEEPAAGEPAAAETAPVAPAAVDLTAEGPATAAEPAEPAEPAETMDTLLAPAVDPAPTAEAAPYAAPTLDAGTPYPGAAPGAPADGYAPSVPPGYPGGFPGGSAPSGAFISATEPKKSKLWILWVVLGVVMLGLVILAAVLIPVFIGMFSTGASSGSTGDEQAAVAAVELYDDAWGTADCDKFQQSTTEAFREVLQLTDCASFTAASQGFIDSVEGYELTVTSVTTDDDVITVVTSETYTSMFDEDGNPTEEPVPYDDHYAYVVVPSDGGWAIDGADNAP